MNKILRWFRNVTGIAGLYYVINACLMIGFHPYSDFDAPSKLVKRDMRLLQSDIVEKQSTLKLFDPYISEDGRTLFNSEIDGLNVKLNELDEERISLKACEDSVVWRRATQPWTYLTDRL